MSQPGFKRLASRRAMLGWSAMGGVALLLAACGTPAASTPAAQPTTSSTQPASATKQSSAVSSKSTTASQQSSPTPAAVAAAKPSAPVTLTWYGWGKPSQAVCEKISSAFKKEFSNITVHVVIPTRYIMDQLKIEFAAQGGPDLTIMNMPSGIPWIARGIFLSLQDLVLADKTYAENLKALVPWTVQAYTQKGKLYGTPVTAESTSFFYNEDLVKKAGLTPFAQIENDPDKWNWNTLREYAKAINQGTGDGPKRIYGIHSLGPMQANWLNYMYGNGGEFLSLDGLKCNIGQAPAIQTIQYLYDLRYKDKIAAPPDPFVQGQGIDHTQLFEAGRLGSSSEGEWQIAGYNSFNNNKGVPFTYNIAQQPFSPHTKKREVVSHSLAVVVNKYTKYQAESFDFVKFMAQKEVQLWISTEGWGSLSANPNTYDQWLKDPNPPKNRQAIIASHAYGRTYPCCPVLETSEVQDPLNSILQQQIWYGKRDVVTGLKAIEQQTNQLIQKAQAEHR